MILRSGVRNLKLNWVASICVVSETRPESVSINAA